MVEWERREKRLMPLAENAKIAEKNRNKVKNKGYLLSKTKTFNRRGRRGNQQ